MVYVVNPYSVPKGGLTISREIAAAANVEFFAGEWNGPCFIEKPFTKEDADVVEGLLRDNGLEYKVSNRSIYR